MNIQFTLRDRISLNYSWNFSISWISLTWSDVPYMDHPLISSISKYAWILSRFEYSKCIEKFQTCMNSRAFGKDNFIDFQKSDLRQLSLQGTCCCYFIKFYLMKNSYIFCFFIIMSLQSISIIFWTRLNYYLINLHILNLLVMNMDDNNDSNKEV